MKKLAAAAFAALCVAACAQQPTPTAAAPPPPPARPATVAPASPSDAQVSPGRWEVARVRCSDLLGAADDDRAAAAMFYYGYTAERAHVRVIDVDKISDNVAKVIHQCEATPNMTVPEAFRHARIAHN